MGIKLPIFTTSFSLLVTAALLMPQNIRAITPPSFPVCSNPQGTLKVSYVDGKHGIVGNPGEFVGADTVYTINNEQTLQCFCSANGEGIQTNWWKISSLTQEEIQTLKNLGWTFVPDGGVWGLAAAPYMAQNTNYSCKTANTTSSGGIGGSVLSTAATTQSSAVLGFAATGDALMLVTLATTSATSLVLGIIARKDRIR